MAIRIHVIAVPGESSAGVVAAFEAIGPGEAGETRKGAWMTLSALRASAADVDAALDALEKSTLRATTVDGAYWALRLSRPGSDPFEAEHHFSLLDLDDLVVEAETMGELATNFGLEEWVDDPAAEIEQDLVDDLMGVQADAIADALTDFGFDFDRGELVHVLSGVTTTKTELGWDTGNLARFMDVLGYAGAVEGWQDDLAEEEEYMAEQAAAIAAVEENPLAGLHALLGDASPAPLSGGSVRLPLSELVLVRALADQAAGGFVVGCDLDATGNDAVLAAASAGSAVAGQVGERIHVLADNWARLTKQVREVAGALGKAREGTQVEVLTAIVHGDPDRRADQRLLGRIEAGDFVIEATYPGMDADTLVEALQLVREGRAYGTLTLRDESEGQAIIDEVADAIWFFNGPPEITIDGLSLGVDRQDAVEGIVQYLFIRRHGEIWDVAKRAEWHREQAARHRGG